MSNDGRLVWVGDLDDYISIDLIERSNRKEADQKRLYQDLYNIGELPLLAGRMMSSWKLYERGISPSEWRHAIHKAELKISFAPEDIISHPGVESREGQFLRALLDLGRPYAVARYARWERLDFPSAFTATLPHGIRALVNQFLASEGIERSPDSDRRIRSVFGKRPNGWATAYRRTGLLQATIHQLANEAPSHPGSAALDRERTRTILSLTRLHFSTFELGLSSLKSLRDLLDAYTAERMEALSDMRRLTPNGRARSSWRLRHVRPLLDLYPYVIRHGLSRALESSTAEYELGRDTGGLKTTRAVSRAALVNELALAYCGILSMRRNSVRFQSK